MKDQQQPVETEAKKVEVTPEQISAFEERMRRRGEEERIEEEKRRTFVCRR